MVKKALSLLIPNENTSGRASVMIIASYLLIGLGIWGVFKPAVFPSPLEVLQSFPPLWNQEGLGADIISSLIVSWQALLLSVLVSLPLAYVCRVPAIRPASHTLAKLRFVSPAVFYVIILFVTPTGHLLKVVMLTLGESCFLVTTMIGVVSSIPEYQWDDIRTLRMSEWKGLWYVGVRGTLNQAIDAIRDNAAMGWSMLMMVETLMRSEGGLGVLSLNQEKHMNFGPLYAIVLTILIIGIGQDWILGQVKQVVCPYDNN